MSQRADNFLKITSNSYYGKLLGGCCYAGLPLTKNIIVELSDCIYVELECMMFINEDLNYYLGFSWSEEHDWKNLPFTYLREEFKIIIAKINSDDFNWEKESFLNVGFGENVWTDEPIFRVGDVNIKVTTENRQKIDEFICQFKKEMVQLLKEAEVYYISGKDIIGWK